MGSNLVPCYEKLQVAKHIGSGNARVLPSLEAALAGKKES
jgi:hypothetical protein